MIFDLREVGKSLILAGLGTVILVGLFALFIAAHPSTDIADARAPVVARAGPTQVAGTR